MVKYRFRNTDNQGKAFQIMGLSAGLASDPGRLPLNFLSDSRSWHMTWLHNFWSQKPSVKQTGTHLKSKFANKVDFHKWKASEINQTSNDVCKPRFYYHHKYYHV